MAIAPRTAGAGRDIRAQAGRQWPDREIEQPKLLPALQRCSGAPEFAAGWAAVGCLPRDTCSRRLRQCLPLKHAAAIEQPAKTAAAEGITLQPCPQQRVGSALQWLRRNKRRPRRWRQRALPRRRRRRRRHLPTCCRQPQPDHRHQAHPHTRLSAAAAAGRREGAAGVRASTRARAGAGGAARQSCEQPPPPGAHVRVERVQREGLWLPPLRTHIGRRAEVLPGAASEAGDRGGGSASETGEGGRAHQPGRRPRAQLAAAAASRGLPLSSQCRAGRTACSAKPYGPKARVSIAIVGNCSGRQMDTPHLQFRVFLHHAV